MHGRKGVDVRMVGWRGVNERRQRIVQYETKACQKYFFKKDILAVSEIFTGILMTSFV